MNCWQEGVQLETKSIEEDPFQFNVYIYNIQEGYELNYNTGESKKLILENKNDK